MQQAILITGGAGFLGRGILRRAEREGWRSNITIYSRDETKQAEVARRYPSARCVLGDVRDRDRLEAAMAGHDLVIHAAALKYIPEAEHNVAECIDVNVGGARAVAEAAVRAGIERVVGLSTDKAAAPLNSYGMTKALMERLFAEANRWRETKFACVRYGNVVGSTGSVATVFARQAETGTVYVTDERMTRFWLTIDDAIDLILVACKAEGEVVIPQCGAMAVVDLARVIAPDADIVYSGIRPGEKLHETLLTETEAARAMHDAVSHRYYLHPPIAELPPRKTALVDYSSYRPAYWLSPEWMRAALDDAREV